MADTHKPIIGVVSCAKELGGYQIQAVNDFYLRAIKDFGGLPIMLAPDMSGDDVTTILDICDGFLFLAATLTLRHIDTMQRTKRATKMKLVMSSHSR